MAFIKKRVTKIYDENLSPRQRTLRFIQDNVETFLDYPENKVYMVEREDLQVFNYLNGPFEQRNSRIGLALSIVFAGALIYRFKTDTKIMLVPLSFIPIPASYGYSYHKLSEFLDYCEVKYKDRGLNDEDLWTYHKQNSKFRFLPK